MSPINNEKSLNIYSHLPHLTAPLVENKAHLYVVDFKFLNFEANRKWAIPTKFHAVNTAGELLSFIKFATSEEEGAQIVDILEVIYRRLYSMNTKRPAKELEIAMTKIEQAKQYAVVESESTVEVCGVTPSGLFAIIRVIHNDTNEVVANIEFQYGDDGVNGVTVEDIITMVLTNRAAVCGVAPQRKNDLCVDLLEEAQLWLYKGRLEGTINGIN